MMRPRQSRGGAPTAGLVLSGGGARGVFQVGVYERLLEHPRFARGPAVISGTSAGGIRLALTTVDANTGQVVRFVTAPVLPSPEYVVVDAITVDMVLASASIPLLFPPVQIGPHLLWDGGLLVNTPLAPVVALGADEIVTVLVTEQAEPNPAPFAH